MTTAFAGAPLALLAADGTLSRVDGGILIAIFCGTMSSSIDPRAP